MTFELVARTILAEGIDDDALPMSVPFGRTGCDLLPNGDYVVSAYWDTDPNDIVKVWKVDGTTGAVLGELTFSTGGDFDGRVHVIALDGYLVQVLYMTGTQDGGQSHILDCSGDTPALVESFTDSGTASGYSNSVQHLYLRSIGIVAVCHNFGVSLYRRGRHLITRAGEDSTGWSYGLYPHPTDERKFAGWFTSSGVTYDYRAWEFTVTEDDALLIAPLGPTTPGGDHWIVGAGNPYATTPIVLTESFTNDDLNVGPAAAPDTVLTTVQVSGGVVGINADTITCQIGDSLDRFAFMHEAWYDLDADDPFRIRTGLVDNSTGTPTVEMLLLEYGASSPSMVGGVPGGGEYYVSLITGSHAMSHRNGEIVLSTCIVEQGGDPNYYSVVSWKLTAGDVARLSGQDDGAWRLGINNSTERLSVQSSFGWLAEAGVGQGLDAPAQPVWVKRTTGWELLGRFVSDGMPDLPDPDPPEIIEAVYTLTDINADLAAAQAQAGATYGPISGQSWGAFVAQSSPPAVGDLDDGSDGTFTTLAVPDNAGGNVEVFTARLETPTGVPSGAIPMSVAFTFRSRATAGVVFSYSDGLITLPGSQASIRGKATPYTFDLVWDAGPTFQTSSFGIYLPGETAADGGRFNAAGSPGQSLTEALSKSTEQMAAVWADFVADAGFYIVVQAAGHNPAHGNLELAEISLTIRYLVP
jgi:hypothetical protein